MSRTAAAARPIYEQLLKDSYGGGGARIFCDFLCHFAHFHSVGSLSGQLHWGSGAVVRGADNELMTLPVTVKVLLEQDRCKIFRYLG